MLFTGVDLIEVERIERAIERHGDRFLTRIFTPAEIDLFSGNAPSLAARWAAKEAVAKALGTGIGDVEWVEVEILRGPDKEPILNLYGNAKRIAEEKNLTDWSLSLSHTHEHAIALVVAQSV
ncbi:MAG: holo-ACP synthase [Anaerolineae bacterium]|nr:holo-ACP synthase [Anaerolineae bacterium]